MFLCHIHILSQFKALYKIRWFNLYITWHRKIQFHDRHDYTFASFLGPKTWFTFRWLIIPIWCYRFFVDRMCHISTQSMPLMATNSRRKAQYDTFQFIICFVEKAFGTHFLSLQQFFPLSFGKLNVSSLLYADRHWYVWPFNPIMHLTCFLTYEGSHTLISVPNTPFIFLKVGQSFNILIGLALKSSMSCVVYLF